MYASYEESEPSLNYTELQRELDVIKSRVFLGNNAAFLAPLMCSMDFIWTKEIPTAATNGLTIWWNPIWFMALPPKTRETVLMHELWHVARLHMLRCDNRDHKIWNYACDIRINNDLEKMGYKFDMTMPWLDHSFDVSGDQPEEAIYDELIKKLQQTPKTGAWGDKDGNGDLEKLSKASEKAIINKVVQAQQSALKSNKPGDIPGDTQSILDKFLKPKIHWEEALMNFFTEKFSFYYSWKRPNRRHQEIYLPSRKQDENGKLTHLMYFLDVSGSVSDEQITRFNSEIKYIKDVLKPEKLTLVQFDTCIRHIDIFEENDPFEKLCVIGRGGTSLVPVREMILKEQPSAAVIFSDLYCPPMEPIDIPTIFVAVDNPNASVKFGDLIKIEA